MELEVCFSSGNVCGTEREDGAARLPAEVGVPLLRSGYNTSGPWRKKGRIQYVNVRVEHSLQRSLDSVFFRVRLYPCQRGQHVAR